MRRERNDGICESERERCGESPRKLSPTAVLLQRVSTRSWRIVKSLPFATEQLLKNSLRSSLGIASAFEKVCDYESFVKVDGDGEGGGRWADRNGRFGLRVFTLFEKSMALCEDTLSLLALLTAFELRQQQQQHTLLVGTKRQRLESPLFGGYPSLAMEIIKRPSFGLNAPFLLRHLIREGFAVGPTELIPAALVKRALRGAIDTDVLVAYQLAQALDDAGLLDVEAVLSAVSAADQRGRASEAARFEYFLLQMLPSDGAGGARLVDAVERSNNAGEVAYHEADSDGDA